MVDELWSTQSEGIIRYAKRMKDAFIRTLHFELSNDLIGRSVAFEVDDVAYIILYISLRNKSCLVDVI